jgi:hypothetical protein
VERAHEVEQPHRVGDPSQDLQDAVHVRTYEISRSKVP